MIHSLMSEYKLKPNEAEEMTEYEYCRMVCFKNLESAKEKYLIDSKKD